MPAMACVPEQTKYPSRSDWQSRAQPPFPKVKKGWPRALRNFVAYATKFRHAGSRTKGAELAPCFPKQIVGNTRL
jgi:hypothetical protein